MLTAQLLVSEEAREGCVHMLPSRALKFFFDDYVSILSRDTVFGNEFGMDNSCLWRAWTEVYKGLELEGTPLQRFKNGYWCDALESLAGRMIGIYGYPHSTYEELGTRGDVTEWGVPVER